MPPPKNSPYQLLVEGPDDKARALSGALAQKDQIKGRIHTGLAGQADPGLPFAPALTARILGHDSPEALRFVSWFQRLFVA